MAINVGVNVSKLNAYAVLTVPTGVSVSKLNDYAVIAPPQALLVSKLNAYTVISSPIALNVTKLVAYTTLVPTLPVWPTVTFPNAAMGVSYTSPQFVFTTGVPPITFSVASGSLPPGLTVSSVNANTGVISGTPTGGGTYTFTLAATNAGGTVVSKPFSMLVVSMLQMKQQMQYYINLFTSQYQMSPKLLAWQQVLMQPIDDLATCIQTFNVQYDLDFAVGNQLDILGQLLGVARKVTFQPTSGSPILNDSDYRTLLYATRANDLWDGKTSSIYNIWRSIFPAGNIIINDNQDMTAVITATGTFSSIQTDLINHGLIVPRPEGVLYQYAIGQAGPLFGFDTNNASISGFDTGKWAQ